MKQGELDYIAYRLAQAKETVRDARTLFSSGAPYAVVNRLYYACFYAVTALLFTQKISCSTHGGVLSSFDRFCINKGVVPAKWGRLLHQLFEARLQGDYGYPVVLEREDIRDWVDECEAFVAEMTSLVETRVSSQESP